MNTILVIIAQVPGPVFNWWGTDIYLPAWATTDEAAAWFVGFCLGCMLRLFRVGLRWFRRVGDDSASSND